MDEVLSDKLRRNRVVYAALSAAGCIFAASPFFTSLRGDVGSFAALLVFLVLGSVGGYHHGSVWLALKEYWKTQGMAVPPAAHWWGFTARTDTSMLPADAQYHQASLRIATGLGLLPLLVLAVVSMAHQ